MQHSLRRFHTWQLRTDPNQYAHLLIIAGKKFPAFFMSQAPTITQDLLNPFIGSQRIYKHAPGQKHVYAKKPQIWRTFIMKAPIAYYLLLLYGIVMFRPLIPMVSDTLSHTFSEAIHIATVHTVYGSNHLEKELSTTTPDDTTSRHPCSVDTTDQSWVHCSPAAGSWYFCLKGVPESYCFLKFYQLKPGFAAMNFHPPKGYC